MGEKNLYVSFKCDKDKEVELEFLLMYKYSDHSSTWSLILVEGQMTDAYCNVWYTAFLPLLHSHLRSRGHGLKLCYTFLTLLRAEFNVLFLTLTLSMVKT